MAQDQETRVSLNLIKYKRQDIDQICLYVKDPCKSKYQLLFNGTEKVEVEDLKSPTAFIDYSQTIDDVYEHLEEYIPTKERKKLIWKVKKIKSYR